MPTYEYVCEKCGHEFEKVQSIKDSALKTCPRELCGQKKWGKGRVKRAIGAGAGLLFKGSGFYITDYRSENYKAAAKKDTAPAASSDSKSSGTTTKASESKTTESKANAKPESKTAKPPKSSS
jgi:putative FmdB family regulatory protein